MGVRPLGFEVFCDQHELFNVTSNALFCILQVWQDFILDLVLRLLRLIV